MDNKTIANLKQMPHFHKFGLVCLRAKIDFTLDLLPIAMMVNAIFVQDLIVFLHKHNA